MAVRWALVVLLLPLLAAGTLFTPLFLVHTHSQLGAHLHAVELKNGELSYAEHVEDHGHAHPHDGQPARVPARDDSILTAACAPAGLLVCFPQHRQPPAPGIDLTKFFTGTLVVLATIDFPRPSEIAPPATAGSEPGDWPWALASVGSCERLVRTSQALRL